MAPGLILAAQDAHAVTRVYVQNNTDIRFSVQTRQHGTGLSTRNWGQATSVIEPGRRVQVLWFNRDEGITNGREFFFDTTLGSWAGPLVLKQRLRGSLINSHMWQSLSVPGTNHGWSDDRSLHEARVAVAGRQVRIRYRALPAGTDDDIEYIVDASDPPIPGATRGTENIAVNVLAYNIYMRPTGFFPNGQRTRVRLLPGRLHGYDAIIFSEAFDDDIRQALRDGLRREYPHQTRVVGRDRGIEQDGGVLLVSKWPIVTEDQLRFGDTCSGSDCKADKGAIYAALDVRGLRVHVFGSHTQADPGAREQRIRRRQFEMIADFIRRKNIPAREPVLIGGDLNVDRLRSPAEFDEMLRILDAALPTPMGHPFTYDPSTNALARIGGGRPEYLDYVLFQKSHLTPPISRNEVRMLRSHQGWSEDADLPSLWDLSDHYPVLGHFQFPPRISTACKQYAGEAIRILTLARDTYKCLPSILSGPRWSSDFQLHADWCMGAQARERNSETAERTRIMHECRLHMDPGNPTISARPSARGFNVSAAGFTANAPIILVLSGAAAAPTPRIANVGGERIIANASGSISLMVPRTQVCRRRGPISIAAEDLDGIRKTKAPARLTC